MSKTPNLDALLRDKQAEHNILREKVRQLMTERAALRRAVDAFLACDGIPPTAAFRHAHDLALAAVRADGHRPPGFVGTVAGPPPQGHIYNDRRCPCSRCNDNLVDLGQKAVDLPWGSLEQIETENEFIDIVRARLHNFSSKWRDLETYLHRATTIEAVNESLRLLEIPRSIVESPR